MSRNTGLAAALCALALLGTGCNVARSLNPTRLWSKKTPSSIQRYDIAKRQYARGEYTAAIKGFTGWLRDFPKDPLEPAVLTHLAAAHKGAKAPEQAKAIYQRILADYADTQWAAFAKEDLARVDVPDVAVPKYKSPRRWWKPTDWFTPDPAPVKAYKQARKHYSKERYEQAIASFRLVATRYEKSPLAPAAWYFVARSYEKLGQSNKAAAGYKRVVTDYPKTDWEALAAEDLKRLGTS